MTNSVSKPIRATAATLAVVMTLMGAAPTLAFCQAMCVPAKTQAAHHVATLAAHHHQSHSARSHASYAVLQGNAACDSLIQVALLRRQDSGAIERQVESAAPSDGQGLWFAISPASTSDLYFPDRHDPPVFPPPLAPLRV